MNSYKFYYWLVLILGASFNIVFSFFTLENTYDALIHLFFANHYAHSWFDPWEDRWYTGFNTMTYPPLVHQLMALLSLVVGLKPALLLIATLVIVLFITGINQFSNTLIPSKKIGIVAMLVGSFSTVFLETLHIFGQLPTLMGISLLMHTFPFLYSYLRLANKRDLLISLALLMATVCSHHVTPIFGLVFFIFPLIGKAITDDALDAYILKNKLPYSEILYQKINFSRFLKSFKIMLPRIILFGILLLIVIVFSILPYWLTSKNDPISQVPIPHGSRDNFFLKSSSGLMFFVIPWGVSLLFLPYILFQLIRKKYMFFGISFVLLFILGTGGTTPLPRWILGEKAFNILTLDRFTFWAAIISIPFTAQLIYGLLFGKLKNIIIRKYKLLTYKYLLIFITLLAVFFIVFTTALSTMRTLQPKKIDPQPIVNFLNQDKHYKWRYLTLGFGDQMAYISALSKAKMVDGNYHSARKLPELTTKAVERLENSKFNGVEGLGSLQQMLTNGNKYHLKFVFSNDKFYDPLLYFYGWDKLIQLENGIWVWEKNGVTPLTENIQRQFFPFYQTFLWGVIPIFSIVLIAFLYFGLNIKKPQFNWQVFHSAQDKTVYISSKMISISFYWILIWIAIYAGILIKVYLNNRDHLNSDQAIIAFYDKNDTKKFKEAYELIDPNSKQSFDQYMLQILVTDGLLNSYGKLDKIENTPIYTSKNKAITKVTTNWITPLKKITQIDTIETIKHKSKWYVVPKKFQYTLPQDLFYSENTTKYYSTGKRRVTVDETPNKDIINSPEIAFIQCNLVEKDKKYFVVGELMNIDNYPVFINITAELYDDNNELIARYDAQDQIKHHLMPKESTVFKVDFQDIAWLNNKIIKDKTYNPEYIQEFKFQKKPKTVIVHCSTVFSPTPVYNQLQISDLNISEKHISGTLYNNGTQEVTIPQLIQPIYNAQKKLVWVQSMYVQKSIKPQRKYDFSFPNYPDSLPKICKEVLNNTYINGSKSKSYPNLVSDPLNIDNQRAYTFRFILNNFIGNEN